jgi:hypothetical protein
MKMCGENCQIITAISVFSIILLAFWFSIIGIYDSDKRLQTNSEPFLLPQVYYGTFDLVKQLNIKSFWHWKYETTVNNDNYELIQACPTFKHDVYLKRNGVLQMRSDGKIFSTESEVNIYDNHNNFIYKITTGSFWLTLLNQNKILVNFHLEDAYGQTVLYVDSTNYFNVARTFIFKDKDGNVVATASKDITDFPWTWKTNIINNVNSTNKVDIGLLMMIYSYSSFSEGGVDSDGRHVDKTDICNNYFFYVCVIDGIITGLWIIFLCYIFRSFILALYETCNNKFRNNTLKNNKIDNNNENVKENQNPLKIEVV